MQKNQNDFEEKLREKFEELEKYQKKTNEKVKTVL